MALPRDLTSAYSENRLTVLVGSGASLSTKVVGGFPLWRDTPKRLLTEAELHNALPASLIALKRQLFEHDLSLEVMLSELDVIKTALDRQYAEAIRKIFRPPDALPGPLHEAIAELNVLAIVTTNYDQLLEKTEPDRQAYTWKESVSALGDLEAKRRVLLKIHGSAEHAETVVLTNGEYQLLNMDASYRQVFRFLLQSSSFFCVGYGMEDPLDIDLALKANAESFRNSTRAHFLCLRRPSQRDIDRYRRDYNVHVIAYEEHDELVPLIHELRGSAPGRAGSFRSTRALATDVPTNLTRALADARLGGSLVIDDAVQLCELSLDATELEVDLARSPTPDDELNQEYTVEVHKQRHEFWVKDYGVSGSPIVDFLDRRLQTLIGRKGPHGCKVAFVDFDSTWASGHGRALLTVRPLNHLVTEAFNRGLALERLFDDTRPDADKLWRECARKLLQDAHAFQMPCPSQLFVELALVTLDGWVPIAKKDAFNSIYTRRNHGIEVGTCGVEYGPRWSECIRPHTSNDRAYLSLRDTVLDALAWEYRIREAGSTRGPPKLSPDAFHICEVPQARFLALAVQGIHLNSALLGYCVLPVTRANLAMHLGESNAHGLKFKGLEFIHIDDCEARVEADQRTTSWHGTALMRLHLLAANRKKIDEQLAALK